MHGEMHSLAKAQEVRRIWSAARKDLGKHGLLLQYGQRCPA
jgi:hypothetical protein